MTDTKEQTITFDDKEYKVSDLTQEQMLLVNHCVDVERKVAAAQFQLQQLQVTHETFTRLLRDALTKEPEVVPDTPTE